jgi:uncharacterized protein (DUF885 family)
LDRQLAALTALRARAKPDQGAWALPKGRELYAFAVAGATTTRMTPDQVHALGRKQVAEILAEMDAILRAQGLTQARWGSA